MSEKLNELLNLINNVEISKDLEKIKCYEYYSGQYSVLKMLNLENIISNKKYLDLLEFIRKEHNRKSTLYIPPIFPILDSIEFGLDIIIKESYRDRVKKLDFIYEKEFCSGNMYLELLNELRKIYNITDSEESKEDNLFGKFETKNVKNEKVSSQEKTEVGGMNNFGLKADREDSEIKLDLINFFESEKDLNFDKNSFFPKNDGSKLEIEDIKEREDFNIEEDIFLLKEENFENDNLKKGKFVFCPLLETDLDTNGLCFDISMVVDGISKKSEAPKEIFKIKNYKEICINCRYHKK